MKRTTLALDEQLLEELPEDLPVESEGTIGLEAK
jgi:hypothetical protein